MPLQKGKLDLIYDTDLIFLRALLCYYFILFRKMFLKVKIVLLRSIRIFGTKNKSVSLSLSLVI